MAAVGGGDALGGRRLLIMPMKERRVLAGFSGQGAVGVVGVVGDIGCSVLGSLDSVDEWVRLDSGRSETQIGSL